MTAQHPNAPFPTSVHSFHRATPSDQEQVRHEEVKPGSPLVFLHINKTAGTALTSFLASHFNADEIASPFFGDLSKLKSELNTKRFFFGHFLYSRVMSIFPPSALMITFLRDPVARIYSQYKSWHNPANFTPAWRESVTKEEAEAVDMAQNLSFDEYIQSDNKLIWGHSTNIQSRFLSAYPLRCREDADSAKTVLSTQFTYFGLVERFEESIELFKWQFQSDIDYKVPAHQSNRSLNYDTTASSTAQERIRQYTEQDEQVYSFALDLFESRLNLMRESKSQAN